MNIYIAYAGTGEGPDHETHPIVAFNSLNNANQYINKLETIAARLGLDDYLNHDTRTTQMKRFRELTGQDICVDYTGVYFYVCGPIELKK